MDDPSSSNPLPEGAEQTPAAPMPSENGGANPLPTEAEHTPAPTTPTESDANPLPADAEHAPAAPTPSESAGTNPLSETTPAATSKASNDLLVPAIGYLPGGITQLTAIIGIIGKNPKAKFHGAQALVYWLFVAILYVPVLILTGILGVIGGGIAATALFVLYLGGIIIALPIYMAYKTLKGRDVVLPVIGRFLADKMGYAPE